MGAVFSALAAAALASTAGAQQVTVQGRVVSRVGRQSSPRTGYWVVLHRITVAGGAPVDSVRTDREGSFRFRASADSTTVLLASVRYQGIAYFARAVHGFSRSVDTLPPIEVFDTTYGRPPVEVAQRHVVVRAADGGGREVLEILELENGGATTRVADSGGVPSWTGRLVTDRVDLRVGEGDFSAAAVVQRGESLLVYGPIPPGTRQVTVGYTLPDRRRTLTLTLDQPVASLALLIEDPNAELLEGPLEALGPRTAEKHTFLTFRGRDLPTGTVVRVRITRAGFPSTWVLGAVVAGVTLALGFGLHRLRGRRPAVATLAVEGASDTLAEEIAALDARYLGREAQVAAADWAQYQERRRALKERLKVALARERGGA